MYSQAIAEREVGQYPLSVATSLALEGATGIHPEIPIRKAPLLDYGEFWVNLRTLFRNFMGALHKEAAGGVTPLQIDEAIRDEMEQIKRIVKEITHDRCKVVFYVSNYANMQQKYPHAKLRGERTDKQMEYMELKRQTLQSLLKSLEQQGGEDVRVFALKLFPQQQAKTLIFTHFAYDLLSYKAFPSLDLVESNTGAIKKRSQWYTKYQGGRELSMIPFREDFLQVFGDARTFFPMNIRIKKAVIELAQKYNWTQVTTTDKIRQNIGYLKDPEIKKLLEEILV
ncbi:hypothetical protein [Burkholderia phage FLC9]|nr:hypothetical protein [Burkholderia phage FLC9]